MQTPKDTEVQAFFKKFSTRKYSKGDVILQPDTNPAGAYFIKQGHVREYGMSLQGIEVTIHIYNPYSYFPMTWVVGDLPNRYYYEAQTDCTIQIAPKDDVLEFLKTHPETLINLTSRLLQGLDRMTERLEYLTYGTAESRIRAILVYLARHFGEKQNDSVHLTEKFTHQQIAALTGLTRETASRELEKLHKEGIVAIVNRQITIVSFPRLESSLK